HLTGMRALVSRAFTPRRVAGMEPLGRDTARSLLDEVAARGRCDVQHDFAAVLPSVVIARLIGLPAELVATFRGWTDSFLEIQGADDYAEAAANIYGMFGTLLAERRQQPRDDLMSALLQAEVDGRTLGDEE